MGGTARTRLAEAERLLATGDPADRARAETPAREARELLKDTYDWFSEGFETADLKEARALLETLEPARRGRPRKF